LPETPLPPPRPQCLDPLSSCTGIALTRRGEGVMPIRRRRRWLNSIDWPQISASLRFGRAKGRREQCRRPHGRLVFHLGDGRWRDEEGNTWRNGQRGRSQARQARPPFPRISPLGRPRWCWPQRFSTTTAVITGSVVSRPSISAAICCTTVRGASAVARSHCGCARPSAICFLDRIRNSAETEADDGDLQRSATNIALDCAAA